jgi:hypothetical protein
MKRDLIIPGKSYTDGKGGVRRVVDIGPQYKLYERQIATDCLRFKVVAKKRGPLILGSEYNCTRLSFAAWAKEEVSDIKEGK